MIDNGLFQRLREGKFSITWEYSLTKNTDSDTVFLGKKCIDSVHDDPRIQGMVITSSESEVDYKCLLRTASDLRTLAEKELIVCLPGRGILNQGILDLAKNVPDNITSFLAITGYGMKKSAEMPKTYMDSCQILRLLRENLPEIIRGATVNPFKYNLPDVFLQYYKLARKINSGASYIVTQAGWDMKKYQELQWYLVSRNICEPVLARLLFISPDKGKKIIQGNHPHILVSSSLAKMLEKELEGGKTQFLSAQFRRISLLASGCKILGYSGIQIGGVEDSSLMPLIMDAISAGLDEYSSYDQWLDGWNDFHYQIQMAPDTSNYYIFHQLLEKDHCHYDENILRTNAALPAPGKKIKMEYWLKEVLKIKDNALRKWIKWVFLREKEKMWDLQTTASYSNAHCPKGLVEGPCGDTMPDGKCIYNDRECIFHRILAIAAWQNNLEVFENLDDSK